MYPPSPFAIPIGSFQTPVAPPTVPPTEGPFFFLPINCTWMPYIAGALQQLLLQATWNTDPDNLLIVQGWVFDLISQFNCATALTLEQLCGSMGAGEGCDCMGCCLRYNNGVLQQLDCGVWTDVPGQGPNGQAPVTQPGAGSKVPVAGTCQDYSGLVIGNNQLMLPPNVSDGDTIQLLSAEGATNNGLVTWYCPDGRWFVAGDCEPVYAHDASCQLPSAPIGTLLLHIGTTYIDIGTAGTVTLAGGFSNMQATLEINCRAGTVVNGQIAVHVNVCNNHLTGWSIDYDFTVANGGFTSLIASGGIPYSLWAAATGWYGNGLAPHAGGAFNKTMQIGKVASAAGVLTRVQMVYKDTTAGSGCDSGGVVIGSTFLFSMPCPVSKGNFTKDTGPIAVPYAPGDTFALGFDGAYNAGSAPSGDLTVATLHLEGTGTAPF